jgi:hypothetical protein
VKTSELKLDEAVVEVKQYKGFREFDRVDEETAKKSQVEINTCANIVKIPNVFAKKTAVKVYIVRDRIEELNVEKQNDGSTALAAPKNNHAESKQIAVKVYLVRAET